MSKSYQEQYFDITKSILNNPDKVEESRIGNTYSKFGINLEINLQKEFPLMELKKINPSNPLHELIWMLKGETNIKYLIDNNCNIWTDDAYRWFKEKWSDIDITKESFTSRIGKDSHYGELDRIYGYNWRQFNGRTDQIKNVINELRENPSSRRLIVTAFNPSDIEEGQVGLPACHNFFQLYTNPANNSDKRELSLMVYMRSNDWFLGNPYNVAFYATLTHLFAKICDMIPKTLKFTIGDCHIYEAHIPAVNKLLEREREDMWCKSTLKVNDLITLDSLSIGMFEVENYNPMSFIKAPLLT